MQALYQRLLAGDPDEATDRAEEFLQDNDLIAFYDDVAIPALGLGEYDRVAASWARTAAGGSPRR